jgi:hypothetical protein
MAATVVAGSAGTAEDGAGATEPRRRLRGGALGEGSAGMGASCTQCRGTGIATCVWCSGQWRKRCTYCRGSGKHFDGGEWIKCMFCNNGNVECTKCRGGKVVCPTCNGTGVRR